MRLRPGICGIGLHVGEGATLCSTIHCRIRGSSRSSVIADFKPASQSMVKQRQGKNISIARFLRGSMFRAIGERRNLQRQRWITPLT
jgi:hypothetical protein